MFVCLCVFACLFVSMRSSCPSCPLYFQSVTSRSFAKPAPAVCSLLHVRFKNQFPPILSSASRSFAKSVPAVIASWELVLQTNAKQVKPTQHLPKRKVTANPSPFIAGTDFANERKTKDKMGGTHFARERETEEKTAGTDFANEREAGQNHPALAPPKKTLPVLPNGDLSPIASSQLSRCLETSFRSGR